MTPQTDELTRPAAAGDGGSASGHQVVVATRPRKPRRGRWLIPVLLVLAGIGVLLYPVAATQFNNYKQQEFAREYDDTISQLPQEDVQADLRAARRYNASLEGVPILDPYLTKVSRTPRSSPYQKYLGELDLADAMARVRVPSIDVNLPVYHGTTEDSLTQGAGHLYGTSLPVGGRSTHAVLTSHTGLATATLFDNLIKVEKGDVVYVDVDNRTLAYGVDQIKVVLPTEIDDLKTVKGKDLLTLFTCTPYAVNTHRLLVRGHRIPYVPVADPGSIEEPNTFHLEPWMWWLIGAAAASVLLLVLLIVRDRRRRRRASRLRQLAGPGPGSGPAAPRPDEPGKRRAVSRPDGRRGAPRPASHGSRRAEPESPSWPRRR